MIPILRARTRDDELRRFPRVRSRCRVEIRDRFGVWIAETEDVGPRGCRIVTSRVQTVGALLRLTLASDRVGTVLDVAGQVVWARPEQPAHAGISFTGAVGSPGAAAPAAWYEALAAAEGPIIPPPPEIEIAVGAPEPAEPLAPRLIERARQLLADGRAPAAAVLARRALALAPHDPEVEALVREIAGRLSG